MTRNWVVGSKGRWSIASDSTTSNQHSRKCFRGDSHPCFCPEKATWLATTLRKQVILQDKSSTLARRFELLSASRADGIGRTTLSQHIIQLFFVYSLYSGSSSPLLSRTSYGIISIPFSTDVWHEEQRVIQFFS